MSHLSLLNSYYSPSLPLNIYSSQLPFTPTSSQSIEQALYTLHQYNQRIQINAQIQALAKTQADIQALAKTQVEMQALLVNIKPPQYTRHLQQQTSLPKNETYKTGLGTLYDQKIKLSHDSLQIQKDMNQVKPCYEEIAQKTDVEAQVKMMLSYFTNRFNKSNQGEISHERLKYCHSPIILQLFDELTKKYSKANRCKEDMLRFVLRKALTFLRNRQRGQYVLSARAASVAMCKRYFGSRMNEMLENVDVEDEKEVLAFLLPYKKNSRNKTANNRFASEIFSSEEFRQDYGYYLEELDGILMKDNEKKIDKLLSFLVDCVKQNNIEKIRTYKRLPWTEEWLCSSKVIAKELVNIKQKDALSEEIKSEISSLRSF